MLLSLAKLHSRHTQSPLGPPGIDTRRYLRANESPDSTSDT